MTCDEALTCLHGFSRPASVAQIGGFRPPEQAITSWFGGSFLGLPEEPWPVGAVLPMVPLLQVRTDELPYCPPALDGVALLTIFWEPDRITRPLIQGDSWQIRSYPRLEGLRPLPMPTPGTRWPKPFPIQWTLAEEDAPAWEDSWRLAPDAMTIINDDDDGIDIHGDLPRHFGTKVGGWPTYIQGAPQLDGRDFVLQIASEEKPSWMLVDNGKMYLFRTTEGTWKLHLDFY